MRAAVYFVFGMHRNKWRFTSVPDLFNIFRAVTVLAVSLLVLDYILLAPNVYGHFFFGKITILLYWFLQMFFLGGSRVAYRYFHDTRTLPAREGCRCDAGFGAWPRRRWRSPVALDRKRRGKKSLAGRILSPSAADRGQSIRGIPVLGDIDDLERVVADFAGRGTRITRIILTPSALSPEARPEVLLIRARKLGLSHEPVALVRRRRTNGAARACGGRGFAAAAERQDRLSPAGRFRERANRLSSPAAAARSVRKSATA